MAKFFPKKTKSILILSLLFLVGLSIWFNKFNIQSENSTFSRKGADDRNSHLFKPPIDAQDEAGRYIQQASENYFFHEFDKGAENYRQAISVYESQNNFRKVARTYESLGDLYKFAHNVEDAKSSYLQAVNYHTQNQDPIGEGRSLKRVGDLYMDLKQIETAGEWYQKSGQAVKNASPHKDLAAVYESIGQYHWKTNNLALAEENFAHAQETFAAIKDQMGYDHVTKILALLKKKIKSLHLTQKGQAPQKKL